ncbi:hypothetical protein IQ235_09855 [Oscillatoriales cyanobacterium LEGE 11467]|uniref:Uncharacterized protein n=1 Tax=Zarconia navalis LEGE 11467 TaxID=1828826 RepID=A0A928Z9T4_9CYAN|nr:hypothetical protein [Zarconia navalis]MBE9041081.1 hypothetical protein [Zarconia navalis LEGE 11467]
MKIQISRIGDRIVTKALLGILVSIGFFATPATAQVDEAQLDAFVEALRLAAPPDSPDDGMYSDWQVLPGTLTGWSEQCLGESVTPEEFEADAEIARRVVSCIAGWQLEEQFSAVGNDDAAVRRAACWWMTGEATGCDNGFTADYVESVSGFYQEQLNSQEQ